MKMLAVLAMSLVDAGAAFALGGVPHGLVVCLAGGWATAQHDHLYQRARVAR